MANDFASQLVGGLIPRFGGSSSSAGGVVSTGLGALGSLTGGPLGVALGVGGQLLGGLFGGGGPSQEEMAAYNTAVQRRQQERSQAHQQAQMAQQLLTRAGEGRVTAIGNQGASQLAALDRIIGGFRSSLL